MTDNDELLRAYAAISRREQRKRVRRSTIRQIEKESGRRVTLVTVAPDGSRTYALGEMVDAPAVEIETPEQLRRLI
jgi:hypothetical protein